MRKYKNIEQRNEELQAAANRRTTKAELARTFNISRRQVGRIVGLRMMPVADRDKHVIKMYLEGASFYDIMAATGVSRGCITQIVTANGAANRRKLVPGRPDQAFDLYLEGATWSEVAQELGYKVLPSKVLRKGMPEYEAYKERQREYMRRTRPSV